VTGCQINSSVDRSV